LSKSYAIAVDIDGTMTEGEGTINLDAAYQLRQLQRAGHHIILASGRSAWEMLTLSNFLGLSKPVVCENGGVVAKSPTEMVLLADKAESLKAYELLASRLSGVRLKPVFPRLTEVVLIQGTFDVKLGQAILDASNLCIAINDSGYAYHLNHKSVDKGKGLKLALEHLNISPSEAIAIGDSVTDEPMFKLCGYSIAVGNAPESVKKGVNHVTKKLNGEGVAEAVRHIRTALLRDRV